MRDKTSDVDDLFFGVRRSIRYHQRRCRFFDKFHKISMAFNVIGGSGTFVSVLSDSGQSYIVCFAAFVAFVSIIDLVFTPTQYARLYNHLARRFIDLEKEIALCEEPVNDKKIAKFKAKRLDIEADEPPILKVLDSICHNEELRSKGYKKEQFLKIRWYERWFCQFFDINEHKISIER